MQWTISKFIYQTSRKNPLVYKGLYTHPDVSSGARGLVFLFIHTLCLHSYFVYPRREGSGETIHIDPDIRKFYMRKILINFLPHLFKRVLGAQKNHLIERGLLSTHNICFG